MSQNKPLQEQLTEKLLSLQKLIKSKIVKGTFTLHGADDETAYFKTLDVLKAEIKELEDKIYGTLD